ncbi:MAG: outer membrane protein [Thermodesulfobacteriota bacterium]
MKKRALTILACAMLLPGSALAYGEGEPYISAYLGIAAPDDAETEFDDGTQVDFKSDDGTAFTAALGQRFQRDYRFEIEVSRQENDLDQVSAYGVENVDVDGDVESLALLANFYYDFINRTPFTPFLSAGIGYAKVKVSDITGYQFDLRSDDDYVLAYQFGGGLGYDITEQVTLDIKYRYFSTSDPEFDIAETEVVSHNYYVGIRLNF